jgi:hypothetical protein
LNKGAYKRKTHAEIKTIEQMYKQEEDTHRYKQPNKGTYKKKTHAQIETIEQRYKQEENTGTDNIN